MAALRIQQGMDELNARWMAEGLRPFNVRIGIHSDAVLVGNIGSKERMSYTVMGDGVNVAARLEGINKEFRTRICISHAVFREAGERLCVRPIDDVTVKGRRGAVTIYEVLGAFGAGAALKPTPEKLRLAEGVQVDGHAPGVLGKELNAYAAAGIRSDHEALTVEEGRERLRNGMWLLIREASAEALELYRKALCEFPEDRVCQELVRRLAA